MLANVSRRQFLHTAGSAVAIGGAAAWSRSIAAVEQSKTGDVPALVTIAGSPRERGKEYGRRFKDQIRAFHDREIAAAFIDKPSPKDELFRYAAGCGKVIREVCPEIHDELEGLAEGADLKIEEAILTTLHEELYHRAPLPQKGHCTAVAVGPPDTRGGHTLVGQTWDWMESVFGLSSIVEWRRTSGPSLLAYGYPGLWAGAGMNSAGIALVWTSASLGRPDLSPRVGLPSYVLLTHLLYQESLDAVIAEARRDKHAGWFTFVLGDGEGNLLNVEGSPQGVSIEKSRRRMVRIGYGTRERTATPDDQPVKLHPRCEKMLSHLGTAAGEIDVPRLQSFFADPGCEISVGKATIDMMVFDTTAKTAWLSRGPSYNVAWHEFRFT
jgi:isopenicillin-N N-acyltransferase-like protein